MANSACDAGRVTINDRPAKASTEVKVGDVICISFGNREMKAKVTSISEAVKKEDAALMYEEI